MLTPLREVTRSAQSALSGAVHWEDDRSGYRDETVAIEEPLEIRLAGFTVAVTMRTPGDDFELAAGFLFTEGILRRVQDIASIAHCAADDAEAEGNVVNVNVTDPRLVRPERWQRHSFMASSCGVCGKESIASIRQTAPHLGAYRPLSARVLRGLEAPMRQAQTLFARTGGVHAAGLFAPDGSMRAVREDVGRHNAVDKVIGDAFLHDSLPLYDHALVVSSRASFEIVQKALMAGIGTVAAVSAPSSLAIKLAQDTGMTLAGFLRAGRFNVYAGEVNA